MTLRTKFWINLKIDCRSINIILAHLVKRFVDVILQYVEKCALSCELLSQCLFAVEFLYEIGDPDFEFLLDFFCRLDANEAVLCLCFG